MAIKTNNRGTYYEAGGIQVMDVIKAKLTPEQYEGYLLGSVIKYSLRSNFKGDFDADVSKLEDFARWLNEFKKEERIRNPEDNWTRQFIVTSSDGMFIAYDETQAYELGRYLTYEDAERAVLNRGKKLAEDYVREKETWVPGDV